MNDQLPLPDRDDPLMARMRAALDEAATVEPVAPAPAADAPSRVRWLAAAAAVVALTAGAVAIGTRGDHPGTTTPATRPAPSPDELLHGTATLIDEGDGPKLAVELLASLPPQGGLVPLVGFDWDMIPDEQTMSGTTWTSSLYTLTGRWDGTAFVLAGPPTIEAIARPPVPTFSPCAGSADSHDSDAVRAAVDALDPQALLFSSWYAGVMEGACGVAIDAWFETAQTHDAIDALQAQGIPSFVTYAFTPVDGDPQIPPVTTLPAGSELSGVAYIIDQGVGPMLADGFRESFPPQGGLIEVRGFDWTMIFDEQQQNGTTWSDNSYRFFGVWDGEVFTLTRPPVQEEWPQEPELEAPTDGCDPAVAQAAAEAMVAANPAPLTVSSSRADTNGGRCGVVVDAWFDSPELEALAQSLRGRGHEVTLRFRFTALQHPTPGNPDDTVPTSHTVTVGTDQPTTTLPGTTAPTLITGSGAVIDTGNGPTLAFALADSLPPQGGDLPLTGFDWSMVDGEQTVGGITWIDLVTITGVFDGATLDVRSVEAADTPLWPGATFGTMTDGCTLETMKPGLDDLAGLDLKALRILQTSSYNWDGHCGVAITAFLDSAPLQAAVEAMRAKGEDVSLFFTFHPVNT